MLWIFSVAPPPSPSADQRPAKRRKLSEAEALAAAAGPSLIPLTAGLPATPLPPIHRTRPKPQPPPAWQLPVVKTADAIQAAAKDYTDAPTDAIHFAYCRRSTATSSNLDLQHTTVRSFAAAAGADLDPGRVFKETGSTAFKLNEPKPLPILESLLQAIEAEPA